MTESVLFFDFKEQIKFFNDLSEETKNYRVVIGSANFSSSAFNPQNKNFENIRVDDSKKLYDLYLNLFNFLLQQTSDYIPEICRRKCSDKKILLNVNPETNFETWLEEVENKKISLVYISRTN